MIRRLTVGDEDWLREHYEGPDFWYFMRDLANDAQVFGDDTGYVTAVELIEPVWYLGEHTRANSAVRMSSVALHLDTPFFYAALPEPLPVDQYDCYVMEVIEPNGISAWQAHSLIMDGFLRSEAHSICRYVKAALSA